MPRSLRAHLTYTRRPLPPGFAWFWAAGLTLPIIGWSSLLPTGYFWVNPDPTTESNYQSLALGFSNGCICGYYDKCHHCRPQTPGWVVVRQTRPRFQWWPTWTHTSDGICDSFSDTYGASIPIWPLLLGAAITGLAKQRAANRPGTPCRGCSYDLTGLGPHATCPECGFPS